MEFAHPDKYPIAESNSDMELIVKALSKTNTDEKVLIQVLSGRIHPLEICSRRQAYKVQYGQAKDLLDVVTSKKINFRGGFKSLAHALVAGGLDLDVFLLQKAIEGVGTIEDYLDLVLLGRSNEDIKAITAHYEVVTKRKGKPTTLLKALEGDLSGDILTLYRGVLRAERRWEAANVPIPQDELEANVRELYAALTGQVTLEKVLKFFLTASMHRLASINNSWVKITKQDVSLVKRIKDKFTGHMENALLYILGTAVDKAGWDTKMLGSVLHANGVLRGNKDEEIAVRVAKMVWDGKLMEGSANPSGGTYKPGDWLKEVDRKYFKEYVSKSGPPSNGYLGRKLRDQTSGHFQDLILRLWKNGGGVVHY